MKKQKDKNKELIIEQLKRMPIVETACQLVGIGRATYYRWKDEDPDFAKEAEIAIGDGTKLINDAAESQLLTAIKDGNLTAIIFWLKNKHPDYKQPMFQAGLSIAQDDQENIYFEAFGKIKPETERLIEPYLKLPLNRHQDEKRGKK